MLINCVDLKESDIFFHIDFVMIRVSSDDFSEENKLIGKVDLDLCTR